MLERIHIERARPSRLGFDLKLGVGGLNDIAFAVQGMALQHLHLAPELWTPSVLRTLRRAQRAGWAGAEHVASLRDAQMELTLLRENGVLRGDAFFAEEPQRLKRIEAIREAVRAATLSVLRSLS